MTAEHKQDIRDGARDSVPIAVAYFAVAFSLGIAARTVGMSPMQGFLYSFLNFTSTGEYAGFQLMAEHASLVAVFVMTLVVNARYILMGAALSQRIPEDSPFWHRFIYAQSITDEIFAVSIHRTRPLSIWYSLAAILPPTSAGPPAPPSGFPWATFFRNGSSWPSASRCSASSSASSCHRPGRTASSSVSSPCPSR